ncbi:MAG: glyoxal reductase [Euryarchaeota archaeon RBG_16_68_12]|nr:MAG: glyoxal reductase [Euryarchaeota archaeon RBG_16_68_12]
MGLTIRSRLKLNTGAEMPVLGLGVWNIPSGGPTRKAVMAAFEAGYRLVDTAKMYGNEDDVGAAVRESGLPRDEVFITTKLWNSDHGYESTLRAYDASVTRMGLPFVDLYLVHWPVPRLRQETWRAMERLVREGKVVSVGVSNYMVPHLEELLASSDVVPAVNQIELSPFLYPKDVIDFCGKHGIAVEAYSPLTRGRRLGDRRLTSLSEKYDRSPAQTLIRWGLQHGFIEIPKSSRPEHIREDAAVFDFEISPEDMRALDSLSEGLHAAWDPTDEP